MLQVAGKPVISSRNKMETGKLGYTTGVSLSMRFTKRLRPETGIQYSNKGYRWERFVLL